MRKFDTFRNRLHSKLYETITVDKILSDETKIRKQGCSESAIIGGWSAEVDRYFLQRVITVTDKKGDTGEIVLRRLCKTEIKPDIFMGKKQDYLTEISIGTQELEKINVTPGTIFEYDRFFQSLRGLENNITGWYTKQRKNHHDSIGPLLGGSYPSSLRDAEILLKALSNYLVEKHGIKLDVERIMNLYTEERERIRKEFEKFAWGTSSGREERTGGNHPLNYL